MKFLIFKGGTISSFCMYPKGDKRIKETLDSGAEKIHEFIIPDDRERPVECALSYYQGYLEGRFFTNARKA